MIFAALMDKLLPHTFFACDIQGHSFFFLPPWWEYLKGTVDPIGKCVPDINFPHGILPIGLAILDMLIRISGLIAVVSIIIAGISYITASGNPEKTASARRRIYNSLIGLGIVFIAAGLVAFLGNQFT